MAGVVKFGSIPSSHMSDESLGATVPKVSITVVATAIRVTKKAKK